MSFKLRCPECRKTFPWDPKKPFPRYCQLPACKADIGGTQRDEDEIVMPFIRSAKTKVNDEVYRQMEKASEVRAEKAAEMAGCSVEDMSALKITNLNEARQQGEVAAVPVVNEVTKTMEAAPNITGFQAAGAAFAQGTAVGPAPRQGARTAVGLTSVHQQNVQTLAMSGKKR